MDMEQGQIITLILADGRRLNYVGRYLITPEDGPIRVVDIEVGKPFDMPVGCVFGTITTEYGKAIVTNA